MLESPLRPRQQKQQPKRYRARVLFANHKKFILLFLLGSFGCLVWYSHHHWFSKSPQPKDQTQDVSSLVRLRVLTGKEREHQLKMIATEQEKTRDFPQIDPQDRLRARYLLGSDLIQQSQGKLALTYLLGLGEEYPLLRPQILFKTAQAHKLNKQEKAAQTTLKHLIKAYPNSPFSANALLLLKGNQTQHQARLIREFPEHPQTQAIVRQRLRQNPNQFELLLLLAKYSRDSDLNPIRDRLVLEYPANLRPEDWEAIADGYWREEEHRKAADAYTFASSTPRNLYRAARGFHRNGNIDMAKRAYQRLLREYHDARETGKALLYLASISNGDEAVVYLEKAIAKFPEIAPQAYRAKATIHERFQKYQAANDARKKLLNQHRHSPAAAEYRWKIARELAATDNKEEAWLWMKPVIKSNLELDFAPKALYWSGKWAADIGKLAAAETVFKKVIKRYPQSYWAWRSAVVLGWEVGDFTQIRSLTPNLDLTPTYDPLPMGSTTLQELYFLGQYQDAWLLLQSEIERHQQPSVNEQFTEGILMLELGRYSSGLQQIWNLTKRENPLEEKQWKALRKTSTYWRSLFPFPYQDQILRYAQEEQINPLLVLSVMRKESSFNPKINSVVGAVGLMQIVPSTAEWVAKKIQLQNYSLTNPQDNVKIGTWYLKHNHQRYDDSSLLAVASYNAGTGNVNAWLTQYGIDNPDDFVEQIPFVETKDYVEGVFGNYWNYLRLYSPEIRQKVNSLLESPQ